MINPGWVFNAKLPAVIYIKLPGCHSVSCSVFRMFSIYHQVVTVSTTVGTPPTTTLLSARCLTLPAMLAPSVHRVLCDTPNDVEFIVSASQDKQFNSSL
jgi:hypothetical protein